MALNATTAGSQACARAEEATRTSAKLDALGPRRRRTLRAPEGEVRIYQHSSLVYWWVVWAYGFACAALTYVQGVGIRDLAAVSPENSDKVILFHPSPWLGISYIALVLFVVVFTNVRARGVYSFMLIMLTAGIAWGVQKIPGIDKAFGWVSLLRVYLNLAFYLTFPAGDLAIRRRLRRSLHVVALLARPGDRRAQDRTGDGACLQHGRHDRQALARRSVPAPHSRLRHRRFRHQAGTAGFLRGPQRLACKLQATADGADDRHQGDFRWVNARLRSPIVPPAQPHCDPGISRAPRRACLPHRKRAPRASRRRQRATLDAAIEPCCTTLRGS